MSSDPIVAEIRRIREELAAKFNYDTGAIVEDARQRHLAGNREVLRRPPRPPMVPTEAVPRQSKSASPWDALKDLAGQDLVDPDAYRSLRDLD